MKLDFSNMRRYSVIACLEAHQPPIESLDLNREPSNDQTHNPRELIGEWATAARDPFPEIDGIIAYA
jgi:hypothetical protein